MRKTDSERRAFLKDLKPRLVAIAEATAAQTGPIDREDLRARVKAGREEHRRELGTACQGIVEGVRTAGFRAVRERAAVAFEALPLWVTAEAGCGKAHGGILFGSSFPAAVSPAFSCMLTVVRHAEHYSRADLRDDEQAAQEPNVGPAVIEPKRAAH